MRAAVVAAPPPPPPPPPPSGLPRLQPLLEQVRTLRLEQSRLDLQRALAHRRQRLRVDEQLAEAGRGGVGDRRPEDDAFDLRPVDRGQAHRARLRRRVERAAVEGDRLERLRRGPDAVDLGVGGRVGVAPNGVVRGGHDLAVLNDHGAERRLAELDPFLRLLDRRPHEIRFGHDPTPRLIRSSAAALRCRRVPESLPLSPRLCGGGGVGG